MNTLRSQNIVVGTAGYGRYSAPEGWKDQYESKLAAFSDEFHAVELNRTFYKLPRVRTAKRWRMEAGDSFEFCVKAWQALTHETSSPTWRKNVRETLSEEQKEHFGMLRPHPVNFSAWEKTKAVAEALEAPVCLIQTPPRFGPSDQNKENMREFLSEIDRGLLRVAWEPRGDWHRKPDQVQSIVDELDLIHVVDPLRAEPLGNHPFAYLRLHGLNEDRYDYRYDYSGEELMELADFLNGIAGKKKRVFCMFNNDHMYENVRQLQSLISE